MIEEVRNGKPVQQATILQAAQPINDIQLVAMIASNVYQDGETTGEQAVAYAIEMLAQACVQVPKKLGRRIEALKGLTPGG